MKVIPEMELLLSAGASELAEAEVALVAGVVAVLDPDEDGVWVAGELSKRNMKGECPR